MNRYTKLTAMRELSFWVVGAIVLAPLYVLIVLSLKTKQDATASPFGLPTNPTFENYTRAWSSGGATGVPFSTALFNSVFTTVVVVAVLIALAAPAGYAIARRTSRLSNWIFALFVVGIILPMQLGLVPLFVFVGRLGLSGTRLSLVLVYVGVLMPLAVFLYATFFRALPRDYEEAAEVDGASHVRAFVQIVLPLMRPITGTVAILCGLAVWKDFFIPLVFVNGTDNVTLPVAIYSFVGQNVTDWNLIFASIVIAMAPVLIVYVLMQRYVLRGFVTGVRG
ncbi:carbohydrate ABC transporter permease [Conexibacter arvalis]|uniref:Raffinose/stachyose/melibiose transport system permease protein n=1 Tax=Conexibacter arvalis TaxID=912552 RepID=A0A840I6J8_9ACTN|nr:carbohydrate ABC transporter permease [Conexibacter arvalis]MBB4660519.1 raffinose/stachyose/melibiose transport system permease protein [Conexibacter arvalis]